MSMPTPDQYRRALDVIDAFENVYLEMQKRANSYPLCIPADLRIKLETAILPHLGDIPVPAKIDEILSEVQELYRLDGRCLLFEGEEYEPGDDGYSYALSDHEDNRRLWLAFLVSQEMK